MAVFMVPTHNVSKTRVYLDRVNPLDRFNESGFVDRFRLSKLTFLDLCRMLETKLERKDGRGHPLSVVCQVARALRYYATGSFQLVTADTLNLSQPSTSRCITNVSEALEEYFDDYIGFPTDPERLRHIKSQFANIAGFPNVIACLDGTHIPIMRPNENEYEYVNRKGFHSINVQVACDHKGRSINMVVRYPGSTHDAHILRSSLLFAYMEEYPDSGIILGDSAYPLKPWLQTPFRNPKSNSEKRFNESHRKTRIVIEMAFGKWKRRFACLNIPNRRSLHHIAADVRAYAVLHNLAISKGEPVFFEPDKEFDLLAEDAEVHGSGPAGKAHRDYLTRNAFGRRL